MPALAKRRSRVFIIRMVHWLKPSAFQKKKNKKTSIDKETIIHMRKFCEFAMTRLEIVFFDS